MIVEQKSHHKKNLNKELAMRSQKQKNGDHLANEDEKMIDSKIMEKTGAILKDFGDTYFSDNGTLKRHKVHRRP